MKDKEKTCFSSASLVHEHLRFSLAGCPPILERLPWKQQDEYGWHAGAYPADNRKSFHPLFSRPFEACRIEMLAAHWNRHFYREGSASIREYFPQFILPVSRRQADHAGQWQFQL